MFFFQPDVKVPEFSKAMKGLEAALAIISDQKANLSVGNVRLFIYIANNAGRLHSDAGLSLTAIAKELEVPYATLVRQVDLLESGYGSYKGLNWIERGLDAKNPRVRRLRLTKQGLDVLSEIDKVLNV
ncbi:hypothetical protein [Aurantimonas sp. HBX-1]|uniref:hypothetical protein n=1 Tax=Aurantimonas sp. HBX-1 TaxID=2906072 RepID=UPI001F486FCB|nr:hypothetical protein [Aurantimonas sp. HBX-1]UIJ73469.1 hypothetical protein LXB15_07505 [Aurantimonas sp. HBX-1]